MCICLALCVYFNWLYFNYEHCVLCTVDNKIKFVLCQNADGHAATIRHSIPLLVLAVRSPSVVANLFTFADATVPLETDTRNKQRATIC